MRTGSSTKVTPTDSANSKKGVRASPDARNAASTAKKPKINGVPSR